MELTVFKMNKIILASLATILFAMSAATQAQGKIAVLDIERAIYNSDAAKARIEAFNAQADTVASNKTMERLQQDGQKLVEKLRAEEAILSPEQKAEMQKKIQGIQSDMQYEAKKMQQAQGELVANIQRELGPNLGKVIDEIVKEEGIGLLMTQPQVPQLKQLFLYVDTGYDITAKVTDRLNKQN
jgi:outer membrane protein